MIHVPRKFTVGALVMTMALLASNAMAQQAATPANPQQAPPPDRYVVGQAVPPATPGAQLVNMTLEQATDMALEKNLDLKVARMNPPSVDYQLRSARAAFNPQFTSSYRFNNQQQPNNSLLEGEGVTSITQQQQNYNVGASQTLPFFGSAYSVNFTNQRTTSTSIRVALNPSFSSGLALSFTQPLLRGFRIDNTRNGIRTLQITRQIADIQLTTSIENTKASVRTAYWSLRQAIEQIEIQRRALALAQRLFEDNKIKVEIGTLAPIDTVQPEANVASAEQALLNAQIQWTTAELTLKRLLASGPDDEIYRATINPTERAAPAVQAVDIPNAVKTALGQRTDLVQTRKNLEISQLNLQVTKDVTKPSLNLSAGYSLSGQGGQALRDGVRQPGGYSDAVGQLFGLDLPTWNFQFNMTYPLFLVAEKANYARAQLQLEQSQAQLKASELTVSADVTNAGLAVENTYKQYQAAVKAREAQERNAEAEQTRFDVGMSTNYNVVQAQNTLTSSRLTELRSLITYLNAVAEFDRIQRVGR